MGMMLNRRRVCGGKSLPYDAEIEYLESQGGCYIPTGIVPTGTNITIKTKIYYIGYTGGSYIAWFSAVTNSESESYRIISDGSKDYAIYVYNSSGGARITTRRGTLCDIELYPGYGFINGTRFNLPSSAKPANTGEMIVFSNEFKGQLYSFYMADGDNILLDLIPVRKGGVGYMYDKVSGQLFGNAGTGSFILGSDK